MKSIRICDTETGNIDIEIELSSGTFQLNYIENTDHGNLKRVGRIQNGRFGDKHWIKNFFFEPIAYKLVEKFEELEHIKPSQILFLENTSWTPGKSSSNKRETIAKISILNAQMQAALGYKYMIEIKGYYVEHLSKEQIVAVIYHELRHIGPEGDLLQHEIEDWDNMVATLGKDWMSLRNSIVDLLDDEFDGWYKLRRTDKQVTLFDQDSNVKPFRKTADQG